LSIKNSFYSDNSSGAHPKILQSIQKVNEDFVIPYGKDPYTEQAKIQFEKNFGTNIAIYFVSNGTSANVLSIKAMTKSYHSVLCTEESHIYTAECGAIENFCGTKIIPMKTNDGKLNEEIIEEQIMNVDNVHKNQPSVVSITQPTELGTVYSIDEIKRIANLTKKHGMLLHMDGARLANAAEYLGVSFKELTKDVGVDVLSFGGTKNGLLMGEAIVIFNLKLAKDFKYIQKQGLQLMSKMRFLSTQFDCVLKNELWLENARQANQMARLLEKEINQISDFKVILPVQSNIILIKTTKKNIKFLQRRYSFLVRSFQKDTFCIRFVTSFLTKKSDVIDLINYIKQANFKK